MDAGCDFADLFEVKDALEKKGKYYTQVDAGSLLLGYERETFRRETVITTSESAHVDDTGFTFDVTIEPHGDWSADVRHRHHDDRLDGQPPARAAARRRGTNDPTWNGAWRSGSPTHRASSATPIR